MATMSEKPENVFGATLTRRQFVKAGGVLVVGFSLVGTELLKGETPKAATMKNSLDPSLPSSWIEIHTDNTVLIRTGKNDFGQGTTFTAYRQIVAEELSVPFEAITTVVQGSTDVTPDGSGAFDFLGRGTPNIRKVAAYTYQALLDLASEKLGVAKDKLSVNDGIVSGGGEEHFVRGPGQRAAVEAHNSGVGRPHWHHGADGRGQSADEARERVQGHRQVVQEFRHSLESGCERNMGDGCAPAGHAACAHGASQDAWLDAGVGWVRWTRRSSRTRKSSSRAISSEWSLPQSGRPSRRPSKFPRTRSGPTGRACRAMQNCTSISGKTLIGRLLPFTKSDAVKGDAAAALASAHKKLSATYQFPYMKHAPIGPTMAVADVKPDGTVHIYTHNQNPQELRGEIAMMLSTTPDHVIVHAYPGPGHYGRSNGGNAGAEDEAALLVEGGRQAGARAVDARRRHPVVHAIASCFFRYTDCRRRKGQNRGVRRRPLHAGHAGRPANRCGDRGTAHHAGS